MEKVRYMISDAAALAGVETHVLRYWEEELDLTIPRNEMGHRYYTRENIQEFQKIKELKEKGYQLKAIRMMLHNEIPAGSNPPQEMSSPDRNDHSRESEPALKMSETHLHRLSAQPEKTASRSAHGPVPTALAAQQEAVSRSASRPSSVTETRPQETIPPVRTPVAAVSQSTAAQPPVNTLSAEERMAQFRELMSDIVGRAIAQNNEALTLDISKEIRETVLKEMNYLMREQNDMTEEHYRQLSAEIRGKLQKKHSLFSRKEKTPKPKKTKKEKRKGQVLSPV